MKTLTALWNTKRDALISAVMFLLAFALYLRTLAPSVAFLFDDTLEFQYVVPRLGIIHPTGYPFYTLLGKLFTLLVPLNDPAFRLNLLSALNGALAVAMVYLVLRKLTTYQLPSLLGTLTFAVGQTFWSQAVIAETYTTQMLIVALLLYLALVWREEFERGNIAGARVRFFALAFMLGLGLTHHRLIVLLYPAIAFYVLLVNRSILRDLRTLARAAIFFIVPLALYLYLPLRGNIGSADGTYENTLTGFIAWVTASQYAVFLTSNPFQVQHDAAYYGSLFNNQFTVIGLALAVIGIAWLLRRPREWVLLMVALIAEAGFTFNYHTANVQVHFLTTFLLLALFVGAGADALLNVFSQFAIRSLRFILLPAACLLLLLIPLNLLAANYPTDDLSQKWDMHDYGLDVLSQPLENNATIIGITGEMTLLRYFQENENIRPDVQTIAADAETARLAAIADAVKQNRVAYLTRPLKGASEKYALASLGPLIRVQPKPTTATPKIARPLDENFGAVKLIGYAVDTTRLNAIPNLWHSENDRFLRVTLYWQAIGKTETDAMVSMKILRSDQRVFGQIDHRPVLDAYPTTAWRAGEIIADTYAVPLFLGVTPSDYTINVTMYAATGEIIGQHDLEKITFGADLVAPPAVSNILNGANEYFALSLAGYSLDAWNIAHTTHDDFGALSLAGYSLDPHAPIRPGDTLPLTLLWRAGALKLPDDLTARLWLEDSAGKPITSRDTLISAGYPPFQWQPDSYVRDWSSMRVPANLADGKYTVKLAIARGNRLLGSTLTPFLPTVADLGNIEIKKRARVMTAPTIPHPLEATFDQQIKLMGYGLSLDPQKKIAQLTLYWRALTPIDTSYTVFVHLLDSKKTVAASADAIPGSGEFPTTGWIEGEYIADGHTLNFTNVPPGDYQIEIGVYDPITGARLKTNDGQDKSLISVVSVPQ